MTEIELLKLLDEVKITSVVERCIQLIGENYEYDEVDEDSFYEFKRSGLGLKFRENKLVAIFLYGNNEEGFENYQGETPLGIKFEWSRAKVRERLGQPTKSGHAKAFKVLTESIWDRYDFSGFLMNITYSSDCLSIKLIALMPSE